LALAYILGIDVISFSISMSMLFFLCIGFQQKKKKKKLGEKMRNFIFDSFLDSACVLPDISVHCALIKYAYI
jgi:hypothetical protein